MIYHDSSLNRSRMKSGYSGLTNIIENGLLISGLWMALKAPTIIHDMEIGKAYLLPKCPGNDLVRGNDSLKGRGIGKKRKFHVPFLEEGERVIAFSYSTGNFSLFAYRF